MVSLTGSVPSGRLASIAQGSNLSTPRYVLINSSDGASLTHTLLMSSTTRTISRLRVVSFNIAKSYKDLDVFLERECDNFDVLFVQEPPWQLIRMAPSASNKEGSEVRGASRHPQWLSMVREPEPGSRPRVLTYVSQRLDPMHPAYRRDLIDDRDVMVISLFGAGDPIHLMNVYSDDQHRAIKLIADRAATQYFTVPHFSNWCPLESKHLTGYPLVIQLVRLDSNGLQWISNQNQPSPIRSSPL